MIRSMRFDGLRMKSWRIMIRIQVCPDLVDFTSSEFDLSIVEDQN
jgi:hypothetical protein